MAEIIRGNTGDWEMVIGLEVHAQAITESKLFSGAATAFGAAPNTQVSLVDAAMPGMLPVLNMKSVEQAVRTGLGLNSKINLYSVFERKNYFYPDLPQGYQISQYLHPIVGEGEIEIDLPNGEVKKIGITRLHLEQDAGKSIHDQHPTKSYVDLNRSGNTLMEIVSEPDLRDGIEVGAYLTKLRMILRYLGTCDGNMDEGSMRADVNISVRKVGETEYGTRCEIKNVNSIKAAQAAIDYESRRQIELLEDGGIVDQETRLWDPAQNVTRSMRSKEDAHDYRYFPDPDLLPLELEQGYVDDIKKTLPELPDEKKHRFMDSYGLGAYDASVLISSRSRADYFETVANDRDAKLAANWVINELLGILNKDGKTIEESPITSENLGKLVG
ncbi:MAG: Asp-tRNA(Asn)/Glu-tRNA(Gln) amidotransferase subunit GatB, partial [Pseudomonadota bacterium]|nr:Asp-tRNA(Asn)/Glu-tRNA(Gln) amidotransferase subunit GatB [Pseudomonadota bacterium]